MGLYLSSTFDFENLNWKAFGMDSAPSQSRIAEGCLELPIKAS